MRRPTSNAEVSRPSTGTQRYEPRYVVSKSCTVPRASIGPMNAAASPPSSTKEMARLGQRRLGRCETVLLGEGHGDAEKQCPRGEEPEATASQSGHADETSGRRAQGAQHEAGSAAHALHE